MLFYHFVAHCVYWTRYHRRTWTALQCPETASHAVCEQPSADLEDVHAKDHAQQQIFDGEAAHDDVRKRCSEPWQNSVISATSAGISDLSLADWGLTPYAPAYNPDPSPHTDEHGVTRYYHRI